MMTKEQLDSRHPIDLSTEVLSRYPNGGTLTVYNSIDRSTGDFHRILRCAEFFARQGVFRQAGKDCGDDPEA